MGLELWSALVVLIVAGASGALLRSLVAPVVVYEWEQGLIYKNGKFDRLVPPGRYWILRSATMVRKLDMRPRFVSIPGQEVLSSDGATLRVTLAARYEIVDPAQAANKVENYAEALYLHLQLGLREIIGNKKIDEVLATRGQLGDTLMDMTRAAIDDLGLRLLSVNVKDITFPASLQRLFAQVLQAQKEGQAALEKARGETAALRHLANAASLVERNPALFQLRLLQQVGSSSGNTFVLGIPGSITPLVLPKEEGQQAVPSSPAPPGPPQGA